MVDKTVNAVDIDGLPDALRNEWRARSIRVDAAAAHPQALVVPADSALALEQPPLQNPERSTRARDEVLTVVAHDLRSPIHTIIAAASLLGLTFDDDRSRHQIAIIQRTARSMERLTAQLLDVARIEAGVLEVRNDPIDLPPLIAEALEEFEGPARARRIAIRCEIGNDIPQVAGDHDRLIQVLSNLLGNAMKFTYDGQGIVLRVARLGGMLQISVEDSGVGIAREDLPHIFTRFWQANRMSRAGAGLGLAICKSIVEAHGGRIWVASVVGRGTTMYFTLRAVPHEVATERGSP